ncbi:hypothetical protein BGP76_15290 [Reichenbachiella sp. MSK19-1]|nr:hypothetical protein BGP76_15290 [Reichenbachiella sp. MSK19-1]
MKDMKNIYKMVWMLALIVGATSCADYTDLAYVVEKPVSVEQQEAINAYNELTAYKVEGLLLGTKVDLSNYMGQGVNSRLVNSNFTEIEAVGISHGTIVQADGSSVTTDLESFVETSTGVGLSVHGGGLVANNNQNSTYLNATIAPTIIPASGGPEWEEQVNLDFETDDATGYQSNDATAAALSFTADGEGAGGSGRALVVTNSAVRENDWESQLFVTFETPTEEGDVYRLRMDVRADAAATMATQAQTAPGGYKHWDFFGAINATTEWTSIEVEITVTAETSECNTIALNLGNTATSYYFDNIVVDKFNEEGGGGPTWDLLSGNDFETDDASNYQSNDEAAAALSFTASGEGAEGSGRALVVTNSAVRENDWESQLFFNFGIPTEEGQQLQLTMDVRADAAATMATQAQTAPGAYKHWDFFGAINATTEWTSVNVQITISAETSECNTIAFNLGSTATSYYFDNIEVRWYNEEGGGEQVIELTPEEKNDTLSYAMETYIAAVMEVSKENVMAWDVLSNPMDNANPSELKSGGEEVPAGEFYWQDYLGKDYAVKAFNWAREYGNEGDKLFITESNMASNLDKCQGLIDYVAYIEEQGATVDGISAQMNISVTSNKESIVEMLQMLAETGKLVRISDLSVGLGDAEVSYELMMEQADMYKYVLDMYAEHVPAAQRYGVSVSRAFDTDAVQGLWYSDLDRKPAYSAFADGLEGM